MRRRSSKGATGYMFNNLGIGATSSSISSTTRARPSSRAASSARRRRPLSRKRLEGVDTIAIFAPAPKVEPPKDESKTYDTAEPMPDPEDPIDESGAKVDEPTVEAPADAAAPI